MPPPVAPAPTVEWISSMKRIGVRPCRQRGDHGLEALLEVAAEARAGEQRARVEREDLGVLSAAGTSPVGDAPAPGPSAIAVLPTPGSPTKTGLFLRRRQSTSIVRCSSSARGRSADRALPAVARTDEVSGEGLQRVLLPAGSPSSSSSKPFMAGANRFAVRLTLATPCDT